MSGFLLFQTGSELQCPQDIAERVTCVTIISSCCLRTNVKDDELPKMSDAGFVG